MKLALIRAAAVALLLAASTTAALADNAQAMVTGAVQGQFKGDNRQGIIEVLALDYSVSSPRDPSTGLGTGKRQHQPLVITIQSGPSVGQFYKAFDTSESLAVTIQTVSLAPDGKQFVSSTLALTGATVSGIKRHLSEAGKLLEDVSLVFQKIEVSDPPLPPQTETF
jgi:type VI secretion system secreted protein Hcp